jgi:nitroreductase
MATIQETNTIFDGIILKRRSIRSFKPDDIPKETVESVIKAGFAAPFARSTSFPMEQSRKFIAIKNGSDTHRKAKDMIISNAKENLKKLKFVSMLSGKFREKSKLLVERLSRAAEKGLPTVDTAPYFIVIAERKGMPANQKQSMAHAMENMWLKATALGLGFQLISATTMMAANKEFMGLLGLTDGKYEIDACVIGYPDETPVKKPEIDVKEYLKWME